MKASLIWSFFCSISLLMSISFTLSAHAGNPFSGPCFSNPTILPDNVALVWQVVEKAAAPEPRFKPTVGSKELACTIGSSIKQSLGQTSIQEKRKEIRTRADKMSQELSKHIGEFGLVNTVIQKTVGSEAMALYAMVDLSGGSAPNWLRALIGSVQEYRELKRKQNVPYPDFVNDPHLVEKLEKKIDLFSTNPDFEEVLIPYADEFRKYTQKFELPYDQKASHLYRWLIEQPNDSISHTELFLKAVAIYGDPWTAMGLVAHMLSRDAQPGGPRRLFAVGNARLKPLLTDLNDRPGSNYHFWGYLAFMIADPSMEDWVNAGSFLRETLKNDENDRKSDLFAIEVASQVNAILDGKLTCP